MIINDSSILYTLLVYIYILAIYHGYPCLSEAHEIWGAIKTCDLALEAADQLYVPVTKSWRLNERMYGALTGLDKKENGVGGESEWIK